MSPHFLQLITKQPKYCIKPCVSYDNIAIVQCVSMLITVTSSWVWWRLESPASRLFTQLFIQAQIKEFQSSVSLAFVRGIHRWLLNSPHKGPVTRKMFPFDDVIMFMWHKPASLGLCDLFWTFTTWRKQSHSHPLVSSITPSAILQIEEMKLTCILVNAPVKQMETSALLHDGDNRSLTVEFVTHSAGSPRNILTRLLQCPPLFLLKNKKK